MERLRVLSLQRLDRFARVNPLIRTSATFSPDLRGEGT